MNIENFGEIDMVFDIKNGGNFYQIGDVVNLENQKYMVVEILDIYEKEGKLGVLYGVQKATGEYFNLHDRNDEMIFDMKVHGGIDESLNAFNRKRTIGWKGNVYKFVGWHDIVWDNEGKLVFRFSAVSVRHMEFREETKKEKAERAKGFLSVVDGGNEG